VNTSTPPIVVIGSGPAGIAAAQGLLAAGVAVTLVDVGADLPADAQQWRDELASQPPPSWDAAAVAHHNHGSLRDRQDVPLKTVFGSDYPYQRRGDLREAGASLLGSHARGGLSNVWGASILPLSESDTVGWPLPAADFGEHYAAVLKWLPHAQMQDGLAAAYPLHSARTQPIALAPQAQALLNDLDTGASVLRDAGVSFGRARLALNECAYCSQCLHGCPYDYIYSSRQTLQTLQQNPQFTYLDNTEVVGITENAADVTLHLQDGTLQAERVYVGTGVLNTALLLLPLLREQTLRIRDSAYYVLPFLRYRRTPGAVSAASNTLAQFFMELNLPAVSTRNVHLQWYAYNDFYQQELEKKLGALYGAVPAFVTKQLLERLWTVQGFLHSDDSPAIDLTLDSHFQKPTLNAVPNTRSEPIFRAAIRKLATQSGVLRGRPLTPALRRGPVGSSFHSGASLPMKRTPSALETDMAGRPAGLQRVHVVDASVLPNIASSTITLTVMANAHRIASAHRDYS
jgi:choline dehydrogenase-like flavoprotein